MSGASSQNKSVRFNPTARFILIRPLNQQTVSLTRYTDDDYKRIRKSVKKTIRAVRVFHEEFPDGNFDEYQQSLLDLASEDRHPKYCARGLEQLRTTEYLEQKMINKNCAIEAVLAAQERLDEKDSDSLGQRIRNIYDHQSSSAESLNAQRLEQRERYIAASYRLHNRWALQNALELAAQDELYVEERVRPQLEWELRDLGLERQRKSELELPTKAVTDSTTSREGTVVSPLHTLATLQESLAMVEDYCSHGNGNGDVDDNDNEQDNNVVSPPSSLPASAMANMVTSGSPSRPAGNSAYATIRSIGSRSSRSSHRPHDPSRTQPPRPTNNWLQHRDSLLLSLDNKASPSLSSSISAESKATTTAVAAAQRKNSSSAYNTATPT